MALPPRLLSVLLLLRASVCDYIPQWSCDFENGFCHWLQVKDDRLDFKYVMGSDVGWEDHTTKSSSGKFLYLRYERGYPDFRQDKAANLMSPVLMPNNGSCKMILHYKSPAFSDDEKTDLFVNIITKDSSGRIHRKPLFRSSNATTWNRYDIILQSSVEFQVEISGVINAGQFGRIGIDDIWFNGDCLSNENSPIRLVKLWSSPSQNYPAGVFYENLNGSWSTVCSEDKARSACNLLGFKDVKIGNYYSLYSHLKSGQGICLTNNITVPTSKVCNNKSSCRNMTYWECKQDYISVCPKLTHSACNSPLKNPVCVSHNQICDYHRDCPGGEDESDCLAYNRCDFQNDMCDWIVSKKPFYEWKRYFNNSLGRYCLDVNSAHGRYMSGFAQLRFKYLIQGMPNSTCSIRFAYRAIGSMHVFIEDSNGIESVWTTNSSRGHWYQAFIQLPHNRTFQLLFEANIPSFNSWTSYFGLENISFSRNCKFVNHTYDYSRNDSSIFVCHSGEAVSSRFVCDFKMDCIDGSDESNCSQIADQCNFDSSLCDWQIGIYAPERLRRRRGRPLTYYTGPTRDHTNKFAGDGYYVYLEGGRVMPGAFGYLISKTMQRSLTSKCTFRWFYHMWTYNGHTIGKLSIIYKDLETQTERVLWQVAGSQGHFWKFGIVTFNITSFLYKVIIKFERDYSFRGDIAVDDVSFAQDCLQTQNFEPITITKNEKCPSVKVTMNGTSASVYQFGSGRVFCNVTIRTDPRLRINLYAEFFNTDSDKNVTIDAGRNGSVSYGGNFSGSLRPFSLISSTNIMNIRIPPLDGIRSHSFAFNITATDQLAHPASYHRPPESSRIDVVRECRGSLTRYKSTTYITLTPRMNIGTYFFMERCIFKFVTTNGYRILFAFKMFDTEYKSDYVEILNNGIIGQNQFSGYRSPFKFISKRSHVEMLFVADSLIERSGFSLQVSTVSWFDSAMAAAPLYPRPTRYPERLLSERCSIQTQPAQYAYGSSRFGEINFERTASNSNYFIPSNCSWKGNGLANSKYLLDFGYIDTGSSSNVLRVNYATGKSMEFRGRIPTRNLELFEASSQFNITIEINSDKSSNIRMVYSRSPGCYSEYLRSYYTFEGYHSKCTCKGYKFRFLYSKNRCYCGNHPPAYYKFNMLHPSLCSYCYKYWSCRYGYMYTNTDHPPHKKTDEPSINSHRKTNTTLVLVVTIPIVLLVCAVCVGVWAYFRKRRQACPRRSEALTSTRGQDGDEGNTDLCVYFVNGSPAQGPLPSYDDALEDTVIFENRIQESQVIVKTSIGEAPPSFEDAIRDHANYRPPQYTEISEESNGSVPEVNVN